MIYIINIKGVFMTINQEQVLQSLKTVIEPELKRDLVSLNMITDLKIEGESVSFSIVLTTPACPLKSVMERDCQQALKRDIPTLKEIKVNFTAQVRQNSQITNLPIKNIIAVSSGKGGVGKSTISVNLATSLALDGAKVGLLDADIYGPNIPLMMGLKTIPFNEEGKPMPGEAHGVKVASIGYFIEEGQALVWRGPMLHGAIGQLFKDVVWSDLDYLIVDLPPGTGDAQLSVNQTVAITGGIIVTTPQTVSLADAKRGVSAFRMMKTPILGLVENMAGEIFGSGGGEIASSELDIDFLGRFPLDSHVRIDGDSGIPAVISHPDTEFSLQMREFSRLVASKISLINAT